MGCRCRWCDRVGASYSALTKAPWQSISIVHKVDSCHLVTLLHYFVKWVDTDKFASFKFHSALTNPKYLAYRNVKLIECFVYYIVNNKIYHFYVLA